MSIISISDIQELVDELGPTLVEVISAIRKRHVSRQWLTETLQPTQQESTRLAIALKLFREVAQAEKSADIARQWIISGDVPRYGTVYGAIRAGDFEAAAVSAHRFMEGAFS